MRFQEAGTIGGHAAHRGAVNLLVAANTQAEAMAASPKKTVSRRMATIIHP